MATDGHFCSSVVTSDCRAARLRTSWLAWSVIARICRPGTVRASSRALASTTPTAFGLVIDEQQIVGEAVLRLHRVLANGDAAPGVEVEGVAVLHQPPRSREATVDVLTGLLFWGDCG